MNQPSLFDDEPRVSRKRDPETSHQGETQVAASLPKIQARMMEAFAQPRTAGEAGEWCAEHFGEHSSESYRKRKSQLFAKGLIEFAGTRRCTVGGGMAEVFIQIKLT